ncbi:MAG TPA: aldehyde dehydrogenase family protein, partial [Saprospiraceae bacterium]|nr:aldehyde dehydrogenase family protein [Saprospiraceae bacterium]
MSNLINEACVKSHQAWVGYRETTYKQRENLLVAIAREIEALGDVLIQTAMEETNLPQARLTGERGRTCNQLRAYGKHITDGYWANACIDTAIPDRQPLPKVDIRKVNQPIGPIVVFGASNFPFAYSTAGGDTASALAAGCTVLLKAHPAHLETSRLVASAITKALVSEGLSEDIFIHIEETDFSAGKA